MPLDNRSEADLETRFGPFTYITVSFRKLCDMLARLKYPSSYHQEKNFRKGRGTSSSTYEPN